MLAYMSEDTLNTIGMIVTVAMGCLIVFFIADIIRHETRPRVDMDPCVCAEVGLTYRPGKDGASHRLDCVRWETLETDRPCRGY